MILDDARGFVSIDASSLRGDAFAILSGRLTKDGHVIVDSVDGFSDEQLRGVNMNIVADRICEHCIRVQCRTVFADQYEQAALNGLLQTRGCELISYSWSEVSKEHAVLAVRRWMRERKLHVGCEGPYVDRLKRELCGMRARLLPSGRTSYPTNGLDFAAALLTLAHAEVKGDVLYVVNPLLEALGDEGFEMPQFYRHICV